MASKYKIGIDVGGTFTDFLLIDEKGNPEVYKTPSTPEDPSKGLFHGLKEMADERQMGLLEFLTKVESIVHGTTVSTNAVLTRSGAKVGLLTTEGFRDILEMRRGIKEREYQYDVKYRPPKPLVPRYLRRPISERIDYSGKVVRPLDKTSILNGLEIFSKEEVEAVAICFLHSYANSSHEKDAAEVVKEKLPSAYVTFSSALLPQIRFYDRVSTTVLNTYVGPKIERYLLSLRKRLEENRYSRVFLIMQSNGGVTSPEVAIKNAGCTILSGPAAGPLAGTFYTTVHGFRNCLTVDMGGTSFDIALIKDQTPLVTNEGAVERYRLALPMLGIHTIGAGGGSIGWVDRGPILRMGPRSAGANPGPACYDQGGEEPTCTDADLILGYLNKDFFLGGKMKLNPDKARRAIKEKIADPLNLDLVEAAAGMSQVINVNMAAGIREATVKTGNDPREFPLVVAGGAGPVHACGIALELEIPLIIVPKESSIFCAAGMLMSDLKHDFVRTCQTLFSYLDKKTFQSLFKEMEEEGQKTLLSEGISREDITILYSLDIRYERQFNEVNVLITEEEINEVALGEIEGKFHQQHYKLFGHSAESKPLELINLRAAALGRTSKPKLWEEDYQGEDCSRAIKGKREIYIPAIRDFQTVDVYDGHQLWHGNKVSGPAIIEQVNTTILVLAEFDMVCDKLGSYMIFMKSKEEEFELGKRFVTAKR